jgi:hypothetical protein
MKESVWINAPKEYKEKVGFVYQITELDTGMKYIGIKRFWKTIKSAPLKGKKNKRHKLVESDWKTYNTSSPIMQEKLLKNPTNYEKKILKLCNSIVDLKATEAYIQLHYYINGSWRMLYNEVINLRLRIRK